MFVIINCNNFPIKYLLQAANPNFKYSLQAILSPNIFLGGKLRPATCIGSSAATCFPFRLYSSFVIWSLVFSFSFCIIKQCCTWQGTLHQIPDSSPPKKACFSQQLLLFNSSPIQMLFMIKHSIYMYFFYLHKTSCLVLNHYKHLCVRIRTWTPHLNILCLNCRDYKRQTFKQKYLNAYKIWHFVQKMHKRLQLSTINKSRHFCDDHDYLL